MNEKINFCKPDTMSICTAPDVKNCKYYQPSTSHSRCMFQHIKLSDGYHCGCPDAQRAASDDESALENAIELIEESKEGNIPT